MSKTHAGAVLLACLLGYHPADAGQKTADLIARIQAVGREGKGNVAAQAAWKQLVAAGPEALVPVLTALDEANPTAANWLRSAAETIAADARVSGKLSPQTLEKFVRDRGRNGRARRLAYEWLVRLDPQAPARLLPGMLDDPGQELRRDAVAVLVKKAEAHFEGKAAEKARQAFQEILKHARDRDQIDLAAGRLKKLGVDVDLTRHYGFITRWMLAGPFDNTGGNGFSKSFPPEKGFDPEAAYTGKDGVKVVWREAKAEEPLGVLDVNKFLTVVDGKGAWSGKGDRMKEAIVYAHTVVMSEKERPVELRAASNNAVRIWLNGKQIFFREEYHHGMQMDQHIGKGILRAGRNEILVMVAQNQQDESWARKWSFQLRICDDLGGAVPVSVVVKGGER